jgi:hypothetical protein
MCFVLTDMQLAAAAGILYLPLPRFMSLLTYAALELAV